MHGRSTSLLGKLVEGAAMCIRERRLPWRVSVLLDAMHTGSLSRWRLSSGAWKRSQEKELLYWGRLVGEGGERGRVERYIKSLSLWLDDLGSKTVVDIGSGPDSILSHLGVGRGIAVDPLLHRFIEQGWRIGGPALHGVAAQSEALPIKDSSVDIVFCLNMLDHVRDVEKVWSETARILRPGGRLFVICDLRHWFRRDPFHKICLRREDFSRLAPNNLLKCEHAEDCAPMADSAHNSFLGVFRRL